MLTAYPVREFFLALAFHHRDNVGMLIPIRSDALVRFPSHMAITVKARAFLLSEYLLELRNSPWSPSGFSAVICGFPQSISMDVRMRAALLWPSRSFFSGYF